MHETIIITGATQADVTKAIQAARAAERSSIAAAAQTPFGDSQAAPPGDLYVRSGDFLVITVGSLYSVGNVVLGYRLLTPNGQMKVGQHSLPTPAVGSTIYYVALTEGYLISLQADTDQASLKNGNIFVQVSLAGDNVAGQVNTMNLLAGYVSYLSPLGWPNGRIAGNTDGSGQPFSANQANPGAGADFTYTMPAGIRSVLQSVSYLYTASATVANRLLGITIDDGANILYSAQISTPVTASQAIQVTWAGAGAPLAAGGQPMVSMLPLNFPLISTWRVRSLTVAKDAGDQISAIRLCVLDWVDI